MYDIDLVMSSSGVHLPLTQRLHGMGGGGGHEVLLAVTFGISAE